MYSHALAVLQASQGGGVLVSHKGLYLRLHPGLSLHRLRPCHPSGCHILLT